MALKFSRVSLTCHISTLQAHLTNPLRRICEETTNPSAARGDASVCHPAHPPPARSPSIPGDKRDLTCACLSCPPRLPLTGFSLFIVFLLQVLPRPLAYTSRRPANGQTAYSASSNLVISHCMFAEGLRESANEKGSGIGSTMRGRKKVRRKRGVGRLWCKSSKSRKR